MDDPGIRLELCEICSVDRPTHRNRESRGELNHRFSEEGELVQLERPTPRQQQPSRIQTMVGAIDFELRRVLLEKGIINNEDFAALYHLGASAPGDREAGEAPSP